MSNLFLLFYGLGVLQSITTFFVVVSVIYCLASGIILFVGYVQISIYKDWGKDDKDYQTGVSIVSFAKNKMLLKVFIPLCLFIWLFSALIPTKSQVLTYISLSEVDKYNDKNTESKLSPQEMIKTIDMTIKKVDKYLKPKETNKK